MKEYRLHYTAPASEGHERYEKLDWDTYENPNDGWERQSLPLGNGYMGLCVFGRCETERVQITENSLSNPYPEGLNNFCELFLDFHHRNPTAYTRDLVLNTGISHVSYQCNGITHQREYFASYPDKVSVIRLTADAKGAVSFTLRPEIPWLDDGERGKSGTVTTDGDTAFICGKMHYYHILYEGQFRVIPQGGTLITHSDSIEVRNADSATVLIAVGTNYQNEPRVYLEEDPKQKLAPYPAPHEKVTAMLAQASRYSFAELKERHLSDYQPLFDRAWVDFGGKNTQPTDTMLQEYQNGNEHPYLEELYFQFGRYLLICSSRKGTLPCNLQGIWNRYKHSPFSCGYWHNINQQMNYWGVFNTNLAELFACYVDFYHSYLPVARGVADRYVENYCAEHLDAKGQNGWIVPTRVWAYTMDEMDNRSHSGPGTGGLTAKMFWDYYAFTGDRQILQDVVYPALRGLSLFFTKVLVEEDGKLLAKYSASPEQLREGATAWNDYYLTCGCAFDQQLIYETYADYLKCCDILGAEDALSRTVREQISKLDPIQVGADGQIKEYREEVHYADIGDPHHRHISHLMAAAPGTLINRSTPDWLEAAAKTLELRGDTEDGARGWSLAHRLHVWARIKHGEEAYQSLQKLLKICTRPNLWDVHAPFQIDGNFGGSSGIAEMLLQSHEYEIELLPALPQAWSNGSFGRLVARGNFEISAVWENGTVTKATVFSKIGGICNLRINGKSYAIKTLPNQEYHVL